MGFLQNDTSNIIVDAALTDAGRQALARNDGSFSIVKFACGDDEVNYKIIKQFGRTIGKEKIEKNTPIFEALTNQSYGQKYRLISISNPNLIRLPYLNLQADGTANSTGTVVSLGNQTIKRSQITIFQTIQDESSIFVELRDQTFIVELDSKFLEVIQATPDNVDRLQRATYLLRRDNGETALGGSKVTFTLGVKSILESQFTVYGSRANANLISTFVRVSGVQSGAVYEFEVQVSKSS